MHLSTILVAAGACIALPAFTLLLGAAFELWTVSDRVWKRCLILFLIGGALVTIGLGTEL